MRQSTGTAAMTALVMAGFVPAALFASKGTSRPLSQTVCELMLGGDWTGKGGAGACDAAPAQASRAR